MNPLVEIKPGKLVNRSEIRAVCRSGNYTDVILKPGVGAEIEQIWDEDEKLWDELKGGAE